ncbi:MAG: periplasmic heavy metal sensor [Desulfovibrio sp.]|nr:periplasmic heavy metal sensor [Desulfovibrio sp.]
MKKMTLRMNALALLAVLSLACADFAQAKPEGDIQKDCPRKEVSLSQEQRDAMEKLSREYFDKTLSLRQALMVKKAELEAQMISPRPDTAKVEALSREIGELRGKMTVARINFRTELEKQGIPAALCPALGRAHGFDRGPASDCERGPRSHRPHGGHGDCER